MLYIWLFKLGKHKDSSRPLNYRPLNQRHRVSQIAKSCGCCEGGDGQKGERVRNGGCGTGRTADGHNNKPTMRRNADGATGYVRFRLPGQRDSGRGTPSSPWPLPREENCTKGAYLFVLRHPKHIEILSLNPPLCCEFSTIGRSKIHRYGQNKYKMGYIFMHK